MVRGVSRMVLELPQPENDCFERVVFFIKPEAASRGERALEGEARALLELARGFSPAGAKRARRFFFRLRYVLCAAAGAGLLALAEFLLR